MNEMDSDPVNYSCIFPCQSHIFSVYQFLFPVTQPDSLPDHVGAKDQSLEASSSSAY